MSNQNTSSLQWMIDAGVPAADVNWLQTIGTVSNAHPVAAKRVKEIQDLAYEALCATMKPSFTPALQ